MPTPSDMPHRALKAVRDQASAAQLAMDTSIAEVEYIMHYWRNDYGIEDLGQSIALTEITLHNIIVQEDEPDEAVQTAIATSVAEVRRVLDHWHRTYGIEDMDHAITLTIATLNNIILED